MFIYTQSTDKIKVLRKWIEGWREQEKAKKAKTEKGFGNGSTVLSTPPTLNDVTVCGFWHPTPSLNSRPSKEPREVLRSGNYVRVRTWWVVGRTRHAPLYPRWLTLTLTLVRLPLSGMVLKTDGPRGRPYVTIDFTLSKTLCGARPPRQRTQPYRFGWNPGLIETQVGLKLVEGLI